MIGNIFDSAMKYISVGVYGIIFASYENWGNDTATITSSTMNNLLSKRRNDSITRQRSNTDSNPPYISMRSRAIRTTKWHNECTSIKSLNRQSRLGFLEVQILFWRRMGIAVMVLANLISYGHGTGEWFKELLQLRILTRPCFNWELLAVGERIH